MIKVIFLDIDGVLNSKAWKRAVGSKFDKPNHQIDPIAVVRLNKIIKATGAKIVISSTWRLAFIRAANYLDKMQSFFLGYGISNIIDCTPEILDEEGQPFFTCRADEIAEWLKLNPDVINFVVLDDIDIVGFDSNFVQTSDDNGLQEYHVLESIRILNGQM